MRVRIRQEPNEQYEKWIVETKKWYQFEWAWVDSCFGDNAEERAKELAKQHAFPRVIELKATEYY